jgi:hypothetical protein
VNGALVLVAALLLPLVAFGLLLWLTHLEETLPGAVERARRKADPPPILAIPVHEPQPPTVRIPGQRAAPEPGRSDLVQEPETGSAIRA